MRGERRPEAGEAGTKVYCILYRVVNFVIAFVTTRFPPIHPDQSSDRFKPLIIALAP